MLLPLLLATSVAGPARAGPLAEPAALAVLDVGWEQDLTPPRWTTPRDRLTVGGALGWRPAARAGVDLRVDGLRHDLRGDGGRRTGPGDIRLGAEGRLVDAAVQLDLRAEVKLPNADDRVELGTDETDLVLLAGLRRPGARVAAGLHAGVAVLGDPHRVGARVAVPRLDAEVVGVVGPAALGATADLHLPVPAGSAPDEPTRSRLVLLARLPCPVRVEARAGAGLAPASPTWLAGLSVGWQAGCRTPPPAAAD